MYASGQIGLDPASGTLRDGVEAQARQAFSNLSAILAAGGTTLENAVKISIFLSLTRQLLFLIPLIYTLPLFMQEHGVWISFPIADTVSTVACAFFIVRLFRKFDKLKDGEDASVLGSSIK